MLVTGSLPDSISGAAPVSLATEFEIRSPFAGPMPPGGGAWLMEKDWGLLPGAKNRSGARFKISRDA